LANNKTTKVSKIIIKKDDDEGDNDIIKLWYIFKSTENFTLKTVKTNSEISVKTYFGNFSTESVYFVLIFLCA